MAEQGTRRGLPGILARLADGLGRIRLQTSAEELHPVLDRLPGDLPVGAPHERFEDRGLVAKGGMAAIHRMFDRQIQRDVAMKGLGDASDYDRMRFVEEAQITGQLEHPNIVPIHDLCADASGAPAAFTMKLVEGETLSHLLQPYGVERGPSDRELEELLKIFLKVCDALEFAHSRGVIHRDLKPENIMVGSFGQVYVMDWGLAKLTESPRDSERSERISLSGPGRNEEQGQLYGTPAYMSIEQAFGDVASIDERTDVYGLGGILYEILAHRPPHDSPQSVVRGVVTSPDQVVRHPLPGRLCSIALKALEPDQDDRYQSVAELRAEVEDFVRSGGWFATAHFTAWQDIVREGERGQVAYIIDSGECEVWHRVDGRKHRMNVLGPGEPFGETAMFSDMPRTATVTALTDVTVAVITRENLERELSGHSWLRSLVRVVATRFVEADRALRDQRAATLQEGVAADLSAPSEMPQERAPEGDDQ